MRLKKHGMAKPEQAAISNRIAACLRKDFPEISTAYIFGSFTGQDSFGDIDIGVLVSGENFPPPLEHELAMESALEKELRLPIDVRILNWAPLSFQHTVIRNGLLIIDKDSNSRAGFEGNVRKRYFDFSLFRKRYLKEVAHA